MLTFINCVTLGDFFLVLTLNYPVLKENSVIIIPYTS